MHYPSIPGRVVRLCGIFCMLYGTTLETAAAERAGGLELKDGSTIVFYGDSITQVGLYVDYVETFLLSRFPDKTFRVLNRGITSETVAGTSEPDHIPPRPNALDRFDRDIVPLKPDVLVVCFGMNDGNYFPFDEERFSKYREGMNKLIRRARDELKARVVILTPPPFDAYSRKVLDPDAVSFGYKFPALDYDQVLIRYSEWLLTQRAADVTVVDVHAAISRHLQARRREQVSFRLQDDGVHPDATGHWLIAQALLEAWGVPALAPEVRIDAGRLHAESGEITNLTRRDGTISFNWHTSLPLPVAPEWNPRSIEHEQVRKRFNRTRLAVRGLPAGRYQLVINGRLFAELSDQELSSGMNPAEPAEFPATEQSLELLKSVQRRQRLKVALWRKQVVGTAPAEDLDAKRPAADLESQIKELDATIRDLRRPQSLHVEIRPID